MPDRPERHTIPVAFQITSDTRTEAASVLHILLTRWSRTITDVPVVSADGRVTKPVESWWFPEDALKQIDGNTRPNLELRPPDAFPEEFDGSGIPELLAGMFPPAPEIRDFTDAHGNFDVPGYEEAHDDWQEQCLSIAAQAVRNQHNGTSAPALPAMRARLHSVADLFRLPQEPQQADYLVTVAPAYDGEIDTMRFGWDHRQWQADFVRAARNLARGLDSVLADNDPPPASVLHASLVAVQTLRAVVAQGSSNHVKDEQREALRTVLKASDHNVTIPDPTHPDAAPLFSGPGSEAALWLPVGDYAATGENSSGQYRVLVEEATGAPGELISAAFPKGDYDSATVDEIARLMSTTSSADLRPALAAVVARTGRQVGAPPVDQGMSRAEAGALITKQLRARERQVSATDDETPTSAPRPRRHAIE